MIKTDTCTVRHSLQYDIPAFSLVVIEEDGYTKAVCYVDPEDLSTYSLPESILEAEVTQVSRNCNFKYGDQVITGVYKIFISRD